MKESQEKFTLEMPKVGIIKGVLAKDIEVTGDKSVNLRTAARPFRNTFTAAQLRAIKSVLEKYGSGKVHLTPRYNLEIPEVGQKNIDRALKELYCAGLFPGGAGTSVRNIFTCPQWCSKSIRPVQELGMMVSRNFGDMDMPNKVTISFAGCSNGCSNGCSRPHNCDIGIIAVGKVKMGNGVCPDTCTDCLAACKFGAIEKINGRVKLGHNCIDCCKCVEACVHGTLDIGKTGFTVLVGGKEGASVRFGTRYTDFAEDFEILEIVDRVLNRYREKALLKEGSSRKKERLADVIDRLGIEFLT
jgi:dissimilatory sulfite reductase (desulfoviridin) alpha/beta subunit